MPSNLQNVGKRLENINNLIKSKHPQDLWIMVRLEPKFLKSIHHTTDQKLENMLIREINNELDQFQMRFGEIFEIKRLKQLAGI